MKMFVILIVFFGIGLFLTLASNSTIAKILAIFTFKDFGVRRIERWRSNTDTLGNIFLSLCVIFCCGYWLLPNFLIIYSMILFISAAACLGVVARLFATDPLEGKLALWGIFIVVFVGWLSACGFLNQQIFLTQIQVFRGDCLQGSIRSILYFLTNPSFAYTVLEGILLFMPLGILWNHFKYIRTEKTLRAKNLLTFCLKMIFYCFLMIYVGAYGFTYLNQIYHFEYKFA